MGNLPVGSRGLYKGKKRSAGMNELRRPGSTQMTRTGQAHRVWRTPAEHGATGLADRGIRHHRERCLRLYEQALQSETYLYAMNSLCCGCRHL